MPQIFRNIIKWVFVFILLVFAHGIFVEETAP